MSPTLISIGDEKLRAIVAPEFGGCLAALEFRKGDEWFPVFQNVATPELLTAGKKAYFVMGPGTARTRNNQFPFAGKPFSLGELGHPHGLHGFVPKAKFTVTDQRPSLVSLELKQHDQRFPYPGDAIFHLQYGIRNGGLLIDFYVENKGDVAVPYGSGSHPMILKQVAGSKMPFKLQFTADTHFLADPNEPDNYLPTGETEVVAGTPRDYAVAKTGATGCDSSYGGWDGMAVASWEDVGVSLHCTVLNGSSGLVHYWNHPARDIWAIEPLQSVADAHNLDARGVKGTGLVWLKPGEYHNWTHVFDVVVE